MGDKLSRLRAFVWVMAAWPLLASAGVRDEIPIEVRAAIQALRDVPGFDDNQRISAAPLASFVDDPRLTKEERSRLALYIGLQARSVRRFNKAREFFQRATEIDPSNWDARAYSASSKSKIADDVLEQLGRILEEDPGNPSAAIESAAAWARNGNPVRALEAVDDAIDRKGKLASLFFAHCQLHISNGDFPEALADIETCMLANDSLRLAEACLVRGQLLLRSGSIEEAEGCFRLARRLDATLPTEEPLFYCLLSKGHYHSSLELARVNSRKMSADRDRRRLVATALLYLSRYAAVHEIIGAHFKDGPVTAQDFLLGMGIMLDNDHPTLAGDWLPKVEQFEYPAILGVLSLLRSASANERIRDSAKAMNSATKLGKLVVTDRGRAYAGLLLACAHASSGDFESALEVLHEAEAICKSNNLADSNAALRERLNARKPYSHALSGDISGNLLTVKDLICLLEIDAYCARSVYNGEGR